MPAAGQLQAEEATIPSRPAVELRQRAQNRPIQIQQFMRYRGISIPQKGRLCLREALLRHLEPQAVSDYARKVPAGQERYSTLGTHQPQTIQPAIFELLRARVAWPSRVSALCG